MGHWHGMVYKAGAEMMAWEGNLKASESITNMYVAYSAAH